MLEYLSKFFAFFLDIVGFVRRSFFEEPGFYFNKVLNEPGSSFFEALVVLFLLGVAYTVVVGVARALIKRSPTPFITAVESYTRLFGVAGAWVILILIVAMVYEVVSRYLFAAPTKWAFEVAYMLMGTSFMFGVAYCLQMRRHIRVDFLYDHVRPRIQALIDLAGYVVLIPMVLWLCGGLWEYFHEAYRVGETSGESAWNPIIWPFKYTLVIGFVLLAMQVLVEVIKSIMVLAGRDVPPPPPVEGLT